MSGFFLVVVGTIVLIAFAFGFLRSLSGHSKKMAEEQARLNKKMGIVDHAVSATPAAKSEDGVLGRMWTKIAPNSLNILLVLAGLIVLYFGLYSSSWETPQLASTNDWSQSHWVWLLAFWGVLAALIALNAGKSTKTLQLVLIGIVLMIFVGLPTIDWVKDNAQLPVQCRDGSAREVRSCLIHTQWTAPFKPENWSESAGKRLCYSPLEGVEFKQVDGSGGTYWLFRAKAKKGGKGEDTVLLTYKIMETCPKNLS